jgi:phosphatidylserine/phosphatidylglycerophosphate/cardiolipin synthase-like enzyme
MVLNKFRFIFLVPLLALLAACAASPPKPPCAADRLNITNCPPGNAVVDEAVAQHQVQRRWHKPGDLDFDPVKLGMQADIQIKPAAMRIIGSSYDDSVRSLAAKIWLIDHAEYSVDVGYYIFKRDLVGYAILGALCDAVQRGVDVRVMVDSLGSIHWLHSELKALENCAIDGGFIKNAQGEITTTKARAQVVVFNAISKVFVNYNRRSHDKLLVIDGAHTDKAWVMTGGRNISLAYYGLKADGSPDPTAYKDLEILIRPQAGVSQDQSVGMVSEVYFSLLFSHKRNKRLSTGLAYRGQIEKSRDSLAALRAMPDFKAAYEQMPAYLAEFRNGNVRLAHELGNLISTNVVDAYDENIKHNPNSIMSILEHANEEGTDQGVIRVVSPYLFIARYKRKDGTVYYDGQQEIQRWLNEHPENRLEIITNSVITSDNFFTQAVIDMDTAPRLLLTPEMMAQWRQEKLEDSELNPDLVESEQWQQLINNPRIKIYQTGRGDSVLLGGDTHYGKLHAKFIIIDPHFGFVGTSNFDYRSRLYNNEMGFFFESEALMEDLLREFEALKAQSYLWGSPEWLAMRKKVRASDGDKAKWTKKQRKTYQRLYGSGLKWLF